MECQGFNLRQISEVEVEGSNFPIKPVPIRIALAYCSFEYKRGNQLAGALLTACAEESISRRADAVFNPGYLVNWMSGGVVYCLNRSRTTTSIRSRDLYCTAIQYPYPTVI